MNSPLSSPKQSQASLINSPKASDHQDHKTFKKIPIKALDANILQSQLMKLVERSYGDCKNINTSSSRDHHTENSSMFGKEPTRVYEDIDYFQASKLDDDNISSSSMNNDFIDCLEMDDELSNEFDQNNENDLDSQDIDGWFESGILKDNFIKNETDMVQYLDQAKAV
jgi:hypothetical protein